ncbi:MAG: flagellar filament capping protein FliD [Planctomycetes bacterium]|nr:flagellar filament capping protein FliD [Planctomycetota bacterium]
MSGGLGIDGLVSGLDTSGIIDALLALKARPLDRLAAKIDEVGVRKAALLDISSRLKVLQDAAKKLSLPGGFNRVNAVSSNEAILRATGVASAQTGSYAFVARRMATSSQFVSTGFADVSTAPVTGTPGTLTIEVGDAQLRREVELASLRAGQGFDRGKLRITDDGGRTAIIDLSNAITLDEVVEAINNNGVAQVSAGIDENLGSGTFGDALVIRNLSGIGNLTVADVGTDATATSLGIAGTTATGELTGASINFVGTATSLASLNDSRGVNGGGDPQTLFFGGSIAFSVNLTGAQTLGDVIDRINTAGGGTVTAALSTDRKGILLTDTGAPAALTVTSSGGTTTAADLGLTADVLRDDGGGVFSGRNLIASLGSLLSQSLRGQGSGLGGDMTTPSQFTLTDRAGGLTAVTLTGREDLANILAQINDGAANVTATINAAGTGIEVVDNSFGAGTFTVAEVTGASAAALGIVGAHASGAVNGRNLNLNYLHRQTALSTLNNGQGVIAGAIRVRLSNGIASDVNTSGAKTVGELMARLDAVAGLDVSINDTGDGLLLSDTTGGSGQLDIKDIGGNAAQALNVAGTFSGATVDRSFEYQVAVAAGATLNQVMLDIVNAKIPVAVNTFGDGSASNPARLAIGGKASGRAAAISVRSDLAAFNFAATSQAQDALMLYGGAGGNAQVLRSRDGRFSVIPGVNLDLVGISNAPVTISLSRDVAGLSEDLTAIVDAYNEFATGVDEMTFFDTQTFEKGPLHGDSSISGIEATLRRLISEPVEGVPGNMNNLRALGVGFDSGGKLTLDAQQLTTALTANFDQVVDLFTHAEIGVGKRLDSGIDHYVNSFDGAFKQWTQAEDRRIERYTTDAERIQYSLDLERKRLQYQFEALEQFLAQSQNTQAQLTNQLKALTPK